MDFISELPNDLLLRILSCLPTKDVLATSLLSKRWRSLWMLVPVLDYDELRDPFGVECKIFSQFIDRSLLSNKAPVLEKLRMSLYCTYSAIDIGQWIDFAFTRHVRELDIDVHRLRDDTVSLPSSLYTSSTLEFLRLAGFFLLDAPLMRLPSLKHLRLELFDYIDNATLPQLLSGCPNLEELFVFRQYIDQTTDVALVVPSLQTLTFYDINYGRSKRFVIDAPGLKYLNIIDNVYYDFRRIENMPELVEANVKLHQTVTHKFVRALASAQRLSLCLSLSKVSPPCRMIFNQLVHLELSTTKKSWWDLLTLMLQSSPKLKTLILNDNYEYCRCGIETSMDWEPPSSVPECLLSSLKAFEWIGYKGRDGDKMMAAYVLKNAACLKTATFTPEFYGKYEMINELATIDAASNQVRVRIYIAFMMVRC